MMMVDAMGLSIAEQEASAQQPTRTGEGEGGHPIVRH